MDITGLLAVSGKPGLYRMLGNKAAGLVIEPLGGGRREFASARQHQFTPLGSIAIFTDDGDSLPLKDVLARMVEQREDNPVPGPKASNDELREYLLDVLPNYDPDRVYPSDMRKLVKWFGLLDAGGALDAPDPEEE